MIINVTERDIKYGVRVEASQCPIARAAHRHKRLSGASVSTGTLWSPATGYIVLPREAKRFVQHFDAQMPVHPFSFEIDIKPT